MTDPAGETIRLLLVENDSVDAEALLRHVQRQHLPYRVDVASDAAGAMSCVRRNPYDVAILDYDLQGDTGLRILREMGDVPCIIVTGRGGEEVAGEALRSGAYDYLIKDQQREYLERLPGSIHNVLARKQAERALVESEARYEDLFNNAPDMYFQVKADGTVMTVNRLGARQLGYEVKDLVGQPVSRVIHPDDVVKVLNQIRAMTGEPGEVLHLEFRKICKDGRLLHVSENITSQWEDQTGLTLRIICRDITAQKQAEERAQQLQERLARSERMESLGILAGGVAHDLNNILGPMVAYPDLLLDKLPAGSDDHQIVEEIKRSAGRAVAVIRDLLTLARRGRQSREPLDLNRLLQSFLASPVLLELNRSNARVVVKPEMDADPCWIEGSEAGLTKVLMNLVLNAYEAMPHGGELALRTHRVTLSEERAGYESIPPGDYVVMEVRDTGEGIRREDQNRIFEPFFTKKKLGRSGSGLGLSVVYGVIKDHRAYIDLTSSVGVGTTVSAYFPMTLPPSQDKAEPPPERLSGNEKILVVDDVPEQREMARQILAPLGYEVTTASTGRAAVKYFRDAHRKKQPTPFDVIVLDMILEADFDGLDTYSNITGFYPGQKCILVTGFSETERVRKACELGAGGCLGKPYTREEIARAIRHLLRTK